MYCNEGPTGYLENAARRPVPWQPSAYTANKFHIFFFYCLQKTEHALHTLLLYKKANASVFA